MNKEMNKKRVMSLLVMGIASMMVMVGCNSLGDDDEEVTGVPDANNFGFNEQTTLDGKLEWRPTANNTKLEIRVTMPTKGWVAVGVGSTSGDEMGSSSDKVNIINGHIDGGSANLKDRVSSGLSTPKEDSKQNVEEVSGGSKIEGDNTILHFMIPFAQDENNEDFKISLDAKVDFLVAYKADSTFTKHSKKLRIKKQPIKVSN